MKRTVTVLLLGLIGGVSAHQAYFRTHRPCTEASLACELTWIRDELDLSPTQFERLTRLHEMTQPRLVALSDQLGDLHRQFQEFETQRLAAGEVDFLEFSQFINDRREIQDECTTSTHSLILASADLMKPEQRERYLSLVGLPEDAARNHSL